MADPNPDPDPDPDRGDDDSVVLDSWTVQDRAGWWVVLVVAFRDEVVERRIGPYLTQRQADVAAPIIARAAGRDAGPPTGF